MNLRCIYCQTPFTLGMSEKVAALRKMRDENLSHYDATCPHCRRANPISRERLEMFTPGWQEAINMPAGQAQTASEAPKPAVPASIPPRSEMPAALMAAPKPTFTPVASPTVKPATPVAAKPAAKPKPKPKAKPKSKPKARPASKKKKPAAKKKASKPAAKKKTASKAKPKKKAAKSKRK
ncbi:MAG: hypothetical protein ACXWNC_05555 [Anaerolineales bacterium]